MILLCFWSLMIAGEWYCAALAFQKCRKTYPWFTALVCFMAIKSLVLFYVNTQLSPVTYFYAYYRSEFVVSFLQLGGTVEVFGTLFRPFWTVPKKSLTTLTIYTTTALALVAHTIVVFSGSSAKGETAFYQSMGRVVSCSTALVLAAVLLFAKHFEMPYRSRLKGISTGLLLMSTSTVLTAFVFVNSLGRTRIMLHFGQMVVHYLTLTIWCLAISRKEALVAVVGRRELEALRTIRTGFAIALSNTHTSCGLTLRKGMGKAHGEQKAKLVTKHG